MKRSGFLAILLIGAATIYACEPKQLMNPQASVVKYTSIELFSCPDTATNSQSCVQKVENDSFVVNANYIQRLKWQGVVPYVRGIMSWDSAGSAGCANANQAGGLCYIDGVFQPTVDSMLDVLLRIYAVKTYQLKWMLLDVGGSVLADTMLVYYGKAAPASASSRFLPAPSALRLSR